MLFLIYYKSSIQILKMSLKKDVRVRFVGFAVIVFWTLFLLVECAGGFYNHTCTGVCGHCVNGELCNKNTGHCVSGCSKHFRYPLCQGKASSFANMYFIFH